MEVDRKSRGLAGLFAEALDLDEKVIRFTVTNEDIPTMKETINNYIFNKLCIKKWRKTKTTAPFFA